MQNKYSFLRELEEDGILLLFSGRRRVWVYPRSHAVQLIAELHPILHQKYQVRGLVPEKESRKEHSQNNRRNGITLQFNDQRGLVCERSENIPYPTGHAFGWEQLPHLGCGCLVDAFVRNIQSQKRRDKF